METLAGTRGAHRRRSAPLLVVTAGVLALAACGSGSTSGARTAPTALAAGSASASGGPGGSASALQPGTGTGAPTVAGSPTAPAGPTLPDGSRQIFPQHRVVAYYGTANGSISRDVLDRLSPTAAAKQAKAQAAKYAGGGRPVLPAFEVIAQIANGSPGDDGLYASFYDDAQIAKWVDAAAKEGMLVVLDLQPGQGDFLSAAKHLQKFLEKPNVGLALDAEWHMAKGQVPGTVIGTVDAAQVNQVSTWLAGLTRSKGLPQKLFVVHQFVSDAVTGRAQIALPPELATVIHVDGFGGAENKKEKYAALRSTRRGEYNGFKLFFTDDVGLLSPKDVLALRPAPDLVTYQ